MAGRRILITGASGAGKSTLLAEMAAREWETTKEPGARVIRMEDRMGGDGLPWKNPRRFAELCLKMAKADWEGVRIGTVLFDRGAFDAALALERAGAGPAAPILARYAYDRPIVLAEPWEALFEEGPERRHSFADALAEYDHIATILKDMRAEVLHLPQAPVAERADWLAAKLSAR